MPVSKRVAILALARKLHQSFISSLTALNVKPAQNIHILQDTDKIYIDFVGVTRTGKTNSQLSFFDYLVGSDQFDFDTVEGLLKALDSSHASSLIASIHNAIGSAKVLAELRKTSANKSIVLLKKFEKTKLLENLNYTLLASKLRQLRLKAPGDEQPVDIKREFIESVYNCWFSALQLQPEWLDLSEDEEKLLKQFLYINQLIVRCKEAAVRVSRERWQAIEERMLLIDS